MLFDRLCVKIILDKLIEAKQSLKLAPLPSKHDRFLRNLLAVTHDFPDLVAGFLSDFGLDEAEPEVHTRPCLYDIDSNLMHAGH